MEEWKKYLKYNSKGEILCSISNMALIIEMDINLKNIIYNDMKGQIDIIGAVPWREESGGWSNTDFSGLQMYIENTYNLYHPRKCKDALYAIVCSKKRFHPIQSYLEQLEWDKIPRLEKLLIDYLDADDNEYVRSVTKKTFVAAVARVYKPGIKFDNILVLCGIQGIGKSTLFSKMGQNWYSDSMTISDMKDKSAAEKLRGIWIMEIGELAGLRKVDVETVKSFLSRMDDQYRTPYETYVEAHPRTSIMVGTTNSSNGFLRDITGNRRFWTVFVKATDAKKVWTLSEHQINQLWAEALYYYHQGECLYLNEELEQNAIEVQKLSYETDPRQGLIEEYLNSNKKQEICLMELWCQCLNKDRNDMTRRDAYELEGMLKQTGNWKVYCGNTTGKKRHEHYGVQRTFVKGD